MVADVEVEADLQPTIMVARITEPIPCVLSSRTDPCNYSFYPRTIVDCNALLASVKSRPSIHSFRCPIHSSLTNSV